MSCSRTLEHGGCLPITGAWIRVLWMNDCLSLSTRPPRRLAVIEHNKERLHQVICEHGAYLSPAYFWMWVQTGTRWQQMKFLFKSGTAAATRSACNQSSSLCPATFSGGQMESFVWLRESFFCLCNIDAWLQPVSRHFKKRFYLPAHKSFSSLSACSDLFVMPHEKKSSAHKEKGDEEHTGLCGGCVTFTLMCLSSDWQEIIDKCVYCLFFFAVIAGQKQ